MADLKEEYPNILRQRIPTVLGTLLILAFAMVVGLGLIMYGHWKIKKEALDYSFDSLDNYIDWNIHINENLGFSIEYPEDWIIKENILTREVSFGEEKEVETDRRTEMNGALKLFKAGFVIKQYENRRELPGNQERNLSLNDWISEIFLPLRGGESKSKVKFGKEGYEGVFLEKFDSLEVNKLVKIVFGEGNGKIYEIRSEMPLLVTLGLKTAYDYDSVFDKMLSTFRFIQPNQGGLIEIGLK